jgi:endonuclease G, mitochondrial
MKLIFLVLFFLSCSSTQAINEKSDEVKNPQTPKSCFITPSELETWSKKINKQFLKNPEYDVIYDNENIEPFMVVYNLKYSEETHTLKRESDYSNKFVPDNRVKKSASDKDYKKSGWDKGHLAPAKDFSFEESAARSTFLYSNIAPQNPYFNRNGAWKKLEEKVREISEHSDEPIQILTGPIIAKNKRIREVGDAPAIPDYFFKTIIKREGDTCTFFSFVLRNDHLSREYCKDKVQNDLIPGLIKSHLKDSKAKEVDICN